jgi:hypothetical protein
MSNKIDPGYISNVAYKATRLSLLSIGVTWAASKTKLIKDIDVGKLDFKDMLKLAAVVTGAIVIDDYAVKSKFWPGDIPSFM